MNLTVANLSTSLPQARVGTLFDALDPNPDIVAELPASVDKCIVVYTSAAEYILRELQDGRDLAEVIDSYRQYAVPLLAFCTRNRRNIALVGAGHLARETDACLQAIAGKLGLRPPEASEGDGLFEPAEPPDPVLRLIASETARTDPEIQRMSQELAALEVFTGAEAAMTDLIPMDAYRTYRTRLQERDHATGEITGTSSEVEACLNDLGLASGAGDAAADMSLTHGVSLLIAAAHKARGLEGILADTVQKLETECQTRREVEQELEARAAELVAAADKARGLEGILADTVQKLETECQTRQEVEQELEARAAEARRLEQALGDARVQIDALREILAETVNELEAGCRASHATEQAFEQQRSDLVRQITTLERTATELEEQVLTVDQQLEACRAELAARPTALEAERRKALEIRLLLAASHLAASRTRSNVPPSDPALDHGSA